MAVVRCAVVRGGRVTRHRRPQGKVAVVRRHNVECPLAFHWSLLLSACGVRAADATRTARRRHLHGLPTALATGFERPARRLPEEFCVVPRTAEIEKADVTP
jgi:hypothetical protein